MKTLIIIGTRPEAIKLIPLYLSLKKAGVETTLVNTGQHKELLDPIWAIFDVQPDENLQVISPNQSLSHLTAKLIIKIEELVHQVKPDYIITQGDTTSCMVGSLVGFYNSIKVIHVEAGLRTNNIDSPFPEEFNRRVVSLVARINFCPTEKAKTNLINEKVSGAIVITGNTGIDALKIVLNRININQASYQNKLDHLLKGKTVLITGHRRENQGKKFENIFNAIRELAIENPDITFVFPIHLNPAVRKQVFDILKNVNNIKLIEPLRYDEMTYLMSKSYLIMTDSGGVQEEAPTLNVPYLVFRDNTERPEGIEQGCGMLAGLEKDEIKEKFYLLLNNQETYNSMAMSPNPFGDGNASEIIVQHLLKDFE